MGSFRTITLFSVQTEEKQRISSVAVSVVVHVATAVLVSLGVYQAKLDKPIPVTNFRVRRLDLQIPPDLLRAAKNPVEYQKAKPTPSPSSRARIEPPALREIAKAEHGPQTLIQPDVHTKVVLKEKVPVPTVAIWKPVTVPVEKIVAPLPQQTIQMQAMPSLNPPNQAVNLSNLELAPSNMPSEKLHLMASTTSPLAIQSPRPTFAAPITSSQSSSPPTPATLLSLSQLAMLNGTVVLPPINETSSRVSPGLIGSGKAESNGKPGNGRDAGSGKGTAAGGKGAQTGPRTGEENGSDTGSQLTASRINVPREGKFAAVVVGDTLSGEFPETGGVWNGRLAYTVYLHVGLSKSWILQYALPRAVEAHDAGQVAKLDAPWPYTIVRPNLQPGSINADALMIHGYINQQGHFDSLSVAFPPNFAQARFVLKTLQQWEFRPATQNGQQARVEVLLIIPEDYAAQPSRPETASDNNSPGVVHVTDSAASSAAAGVFTVTANLTRPASSAQPAARQADPPTGSRPRQRARK